MVLARLQALERRMDEVLAVLRGIEGRCRAEQAESAALAGEVRALREKANFALRVIWSVAAWAAVAAAGAVLAAAGLAR